MPFQKGNRFGATSRGKSNEGRTKKVDAMKNLMTDLLHSQYPETLMANIEDARGSMIFLQRTETGVPNVYDWKRVSDPEQVMKLIHKGDTSLYKIALKDPNTKAFMYLSDQTLGKAKESVEISGGVTLIMDE